MYAGRHRRDRAGGRRDQSPAASVHGRADGIDPEDPRRACAADADRRLDAAIDGGPARLRVPSAVPARVRPLQAPATRADGRGREPRGMLAARSGGAPRSHERGDACRGIVDRGCERSGAARGRQEYDVKRRAARAQRRRALLRRLAAVAQPRDRTQAARAAEGGRRRGPCDPPRRDARPGRRIGLRQVDDRARHRRPVHADARHDPLRRRGAGRRGCAGTPTRRRSDARGAACR